MKKRLLVLIPALSMLLGACGGGGSPIIEKSDFEGITFLDATVDYDGNPHTIEVVGAPSFALVTYQDNGPFTDAGIYPMSATITADNYNDLTLNATLTIDGESFSGISFSNVTVDYDGNPHTIEVVGAPSFALVTYQNNGPFTDAGTYPMSATITADNYNDLTLNASLTIGKIPFGNITFDNQTFEYDGRPHSITITGNVPPNATITYASIETPSRDNYATDVGEYSIQATIKEKNHNDLVLNAVLKITAFDNERFMVPNGDNLYFQNAIDDDKLYVANLLDSELTKISNDRAKDMIPFGTGIMFVSKSFASSINSVIPASQTFEREIIYTKNARYIQKGVGNIIYYAQNSFTNESSGIFKLDYTNSNSPVETKLSIGKAKYLTLVGSTLYFADGTNGWKLSSISTSGVDQVRTLVVDEKINCLICNSGVLFYTVNNLLGDYIERFSISGGVRKKLTSDAGASLSIVGSDIYYVNVDLLSSSIIGDGIYRVNKAPISDNNNPGTKVIAASEQGFCSLTSDGGTKLYYYDVNGYKLIRYDINTQGSTNLLEGFVKPEDPAPTSVSDGLNIQSYGGVIYYQDLWDGKTLHQYNPITKANVRVTSNKVASFSIIGDEIYFNLVTWLVNNDTYKMNLKTGGEPELINVKSGFDFVQLGDYIYYSMDNEIGAATAIHRFNLTTYVDEEMYAKGVSNLRVANGKVLFIDNYQIFILDPATKVVSEIKADTKSVHTTAFDTDGTYIFYREMSGFGYTTKKLSRMNLDGSNKIGVVTSSTDPTSIKVIGNNVYYYTDTLTGTNGLYRVSKTATEMSGDLVLATAGTYYSECFAVVGNALYFINVNLGGLEGDSRLYSLSLDGGTPIKIG